MAQRWPTRSGDERDRRSDCPPARKSVLRYSHTRVASELSFGRRPCRCSTLCAHQGTPVYRWLSASIPPDRIDLTPRATLALNVVLSRLSDQGQGLEALLPRGQNGAAVMPTRCSSVVLRSRPGFESFHRIPSRALAHLHHSQMSHSPARHRKLGRTQGYTHNVGRWLRWPSGKFCGWCLRRLGQGRRLRIVACQKGSSRSFTVWKPRASFVSGKASSRERIFRGTNLPNPKCPLAASETGKPSRQPGSRVLPSEAWPRIQAKGGLSFILYCAIFGVHPFEAFASNLDLSPFVFHSGFRWIDEDGHIQPPPPKRGSCGASLLSVRFGSAPGWWQTSLSQPAAWSACGTLTSRSRASDSTSS